MDWAGQERADQDKAGLSLARAALVGARRGQIRTVEEIRTVAGVGARRGQNRTQGTPYLCTARIASMASFTRTVMSVRVYCVNTTDFSKRVPSASHDRKDKAGQKKLCQDKADQYRRTRRTRMLLSYTCRLKMREPQTRARARDGWVTAP
eukprot:1215453-Rhodomonas_salina.1